VLNAGQLGVRISVEGQALPVSWLRQAGNFELAWDLPEGLAAKPKLTLAIEVDRTFKVPGDTRDLGLPVSSIEIQ
jgi:hypothetical protein